MRPTYRASAIARACSLIIAASAATFLPRAGVAQDVEEILSYDVAIRVTPGASMIVHEAITVRSQGREIRRGIYRDFPTSFPRAAGLGRIEAPFAVRSVTRDGSAEPFELSSIGTNFGRGGIRVRIGSPNVFLDPGVYRYDIEYETSRWIHFGDGEDELYWNVTGNGWGFSIRSASATVTVEGLGIEPAMDAWTGPEGSTESAASKSWTLEGGAHFESTRVLNPEEGLTISVRFPSGLITPPSAEQEAEWFRLDWGGYIDAGYIIVLIMAVYLLMWFRVGRDPEAGHIVTQYTPPEGFSATALGYLKDRGWKQSQFAASLVSMAVAGAVRIEKSGKRWTLHRTGNAVDLGPDEQVVYRELLSRRDSLHLTQSNHKTLSGATKGLKNTLKKRLEKEYFVNNRWWFGLGLGVSLLGFLALSWRWRYGIETPAWFLGIWLSGWTAGVGTMLWRAVTDFSLGRRGAGAGHYIAGLAMGCFSIPFVAAWLYVGAMFVSMVPTHIFLAAIAIGTTNIVFYHLLERPTLKGRGVLNRLEGFERFLAATDADRLHRSLEEDPSPELFERYLPHAIALGLEREWATQFEWVLDPKGVMGSSQTFHWYTGDGGAMDATTLSTSLGGAFSSTLSSASAAPSSRGTGGGGGGSSGGGGGGGGGGGW